MGEEADGLRERARECLRLANVCRDELVKEELLKLACEFEEEAAKLDGTNGGAAG